MVTKQTQAVKPLEKEQRDQLAEVTARIARDAGLDPESYLKESEVPHGGE